MKRQLIVTVESCAECPYHFMYINNGEVEYHYCRGNEANRVPVSETINEDLFANCHFEEIKDNILPISGKKGLLQSIKDLLTNRKLPNIL